MRRLTFITSAICATLMISTGAFRQVPADPITQTKPCRTQLKSFHTAGSINLATAKKVAEAAAAEVAKRNRKDAFCIERCLSVGDLVYFIKGR